MFRMAVARSPGSASWAKKATVAAPQSTTSADSVLRTNCRATARPLLDEIRVIERRTSLRVLLPHVLQLRRHGEGAQPVVDADRQRVLGDVVLGLLVVGVLFGDIRFGVAVEDVLGERVVVVEGTVAVVGSVSRAGPPVDVEDASGHRGPVPDAE